MSSVAVVGSGLVGCLGALGLSKRGYKVTLYELRDDPRKSVNKNLRSINLAVSDRGINALKYVDEQLASEILEKVIPMYGRMIHKLDGKQESQKYSLYGEAINSIDRSYLNNLLLDEVEKSGIEVKFNHKLLKMDLKDTPTLYFQGDEEPVIVNLVVGADGSFSRVRQELQKFVRMDYSQEYIDCAYLELSIPAAEKVEGEERFKLNKNHLHIWPRHKFMLIALANLDGSFTSTFFAPWSMFDELDTDEKVLRFFKQQFPDAVDLIGEDKLLHAFNNHPRGSLLSLRCNKYHHKDNAILIGDAAHAMVPFYGQGMNCGFEDVFVLLSLLEKNDLDLAATFKEYSETRVKDLAAIVDLAIGNYNEMSHKVTSTLFLFRKQVDFLLTYLLKDKWLPLYTMVSFRSDIPYHSAIKIFQRQDRILHWIQNTLLAATTFGVFKLVKYLRKN